MTDTFYVKNNAGQYVLAKFLQVNGQYVVDPNATKGALSQASVARNTLKSTRQIKAPTMLLKTNSYEIRS
jgi:hypothetical protein